MDAKQKKLLPLRQWEQLMYRNSLCSASNLGVSMTPGHANSPRVGALLFWSWWRLQCSLVKWNGNERSPVSTKTSTIGQFGVSWIQGIGTMGSAFLDENWDDRQADWASRSLKDVSAAGCHQWQVTALLQEPCPGCPEICSPPGKIITTSAMIRPLLTNMETRSQLSENHLVNLPTGWGVCPEGKPWGLTQQPSTHCKN